MIVYHGSDQEIRYPDVLHSRKRVDFGPGFYVTPIYKQAQSWASRFLRNGKPGVITEYVLDDTALELPNVLRFDEYNEEWLDYIFACRKGKVPGNYDIVMGGVANDKVFDTVELFFAGLIDKTVALSRLIYEKPNYQICLRTQRIIDDYLQFRGSEVQ
ncbi:MAG: DUF3990 domain-containing protein [Clostridia bacterium]|nr:DUF3990 domain-containing protein [Clostridia bacterium]